MLPIVSPMTLAYNIAQSLYNSPMITKDVLDIDRLLKSKRIN